MNILLFILPLIAMGLTLAPMYPVLAFKNKKYSVHTRLAIHLVLFFMVLIFATIYFITNSVSAASYSVSGGGGQFLSQASQAKNLKSNILGLGEGLKYIGAAIATGLACIGAGVAVGGAAPAAIGAYSENPETFGKAMIFVVLGEGIAIYGFVISFLILFSN